MANPWRLLVCAAALIVIVNTGVAGAQTVYVRKAPPGATIELLVNTATVASATADRSGDAPLPFVLARTIAKTQADIFLYVDICDQSRRVILVERGVTPPNPGACERRPIPGLFLVRTGITSMVVDLSGTDPTMHLRQGRVPAEWLRDVPVNQVRERRLAPTGLVVSAGGGFASFSDAVGISCGSVTDCSGDGSGFAFGASVAVWLTRWLGAEGSYVRPADATTSGSGTAYRFDSALDAHVFNIVGKVAAPAGPVRVYAQVGPTFHRATLETNQTIDDVTITVDNVPTTIKGGTQKFELKTEGWSWMFGGGLEGWVSNAVALYGEFGRTPLKGKNETGGEGEIDDKLLYFLFGVRVHIGR